MSLSATYIYPAGFNNASFTRYLTATLYASAGSLSGIATNNTDSISWTFPTFVTPYSSINLVSTNIYPTTIVSNTATNISFLSGATAPLSSINTIYLTFNSSTYDDSTSSYTLCSLPINCTFVSNASYSNPATYTQTFDTFPDIKLNAFVNFESTLNSSYFYRLTSTTPFKAQVAFNSLTLGSLSASSSLFSVSATVNSTTTAISCFNVPLNLSCSAVCVSSFGITVSALSGINSLSAWYSPHVFQQSISARFVPYFLSAGFIGFTDTVFASGYVYPANSSNYNNVASSTPAVSAGLSFLGEGHTANITLTANRDTNIKQYNWSISKYSHPLSSISFTTSSLTAINSSTLTTSSAQVTATIPTSPALALTLPVNLQVGDSNYFILSTNPPTTRYDDVSGTSSFYPYYSSTLTTNNVEASATNNVFHQSIVVSTYDTSNYVLYPGAGLTPNIYLSPNGSPVFYRSTVTSSSGTNNIKCFDKYQLIWTWAALSSVSNGNANSLPYPITNWTTAPSSWAMTQCLSTCSSSSLSTVITATSGLFAKTWANQGAGALSGALTPIQTTQLGGITWSVTDNIWTYPAITVTNNATNTFDFTLQLSADGSVLTNTGGTASTYQDTNITLQAQLCVLAQIPGIVGKSGVVIDWLARNIPLTLTYNLTSIGLPYPKIYTSNRYVLTGNNITFQNITTKSSLVTAISANFDNTNYLYITGDSFNRTFTVNSSSIGYKDLTLISYTTLPNQPVIKTVFPSIVQVVPQYDTIITDDYRTQNSPINLPWPEQPKVGSNDWVIDDNINSCIKKIYDNLNYLDLISKSYSNTYTEYFGYLSPVIYSTAGGTLVCPTWTWEDVNTFINPSNTVIWDDTSLSGKYVNCSTWEQQTYQYTNITTTLTASKNIPFTVCNPGTWNVNIPGLDQNYLTINNGNTVNKKCVYTGIVSKNNNLYATLPTQINLLSSDYVATLYNAKNTVDGIKTFSYITNICVDSNNRIFVLDSNFAQIYTFTTDQYNNWNLFNSWGGFGLATSKTKFNAPNDIHIDQLNNVWICDTGNKAVKQYSNTGTWIQTIYDSNLIANPPISLAVDSQQNVHILTASGVLVYSYSGVYQSTYNYGEYVNTTVPRRINTSYNREIIYIAFNTQVVKFFRTGVFAGYIINSIPGITNINGLYQDEFRNLLVTSDNIILKFPDLMQLVPRKGNLPSYYWSLNDLLIHKEEYVQNWVYTKSFQRLWDNIEYFRNTLCYSSGNCLSYSAPLHDKSKMIIGQNEIVTSTVINRILGYLWDNFYTFVKYYDPNCNN
jgi:hypothetical protein